jgi:hypothetical protein
MDGELEGSMYGLEDTQGHHHDNDEDDKPATVIQPKDYTHAESATAVIQDNNDARSELAAAVGAAVDVALQAEAAAAAAAAAGEQQAAAAMQQGAVLIQEIGQIVPGGRVVGWVSMAPMRLGHACAGMRQAAGHAMEQLFSILGSSNTAAAGVEARANAASGEMQQAAAVEQQQQRARRSWGSALSQRMFGGPQVAVQ